MSVKITGTFRAWYTGMVGTVVRTDGEITTVRFEGHGCVTVPATLVVPAETLAAYVTGGAS